MGKVSIQTKQRIAHLFGKDNLRPCQIHRKLLGEGISISQQMVRIVIAQHMRGEPLVPKKYKKKYLKVKMEHRIHFSEHFRIWDNRGDSLQVIIFINIFFACNIAIITHCSTCTYMYTLYIYTFLTLTLQESVDKFKETLGLDISVASLSRHKRQLGFPMGNAQKCNTTRDKNLDLRYQFACRMLKANHQLNHYIFADESTFQTHANRIRGTDIQNYDEKGRKKGKLNKYKTYQPEHPLKVHVWGGISRRGKTKLLIFKGIMDGPFYTEQCLTTYQESAKTLYPHGDVTMWADNDPKHTCKQATAYIREHGVATIKTPAESPDMNPVENIWAQMKSDLRRERPKTQETLCNCLLRAWKRITVKDCNSYINHVQKKVFREVVRVKGYATGM